MEWATFGDLSQTLQFFAALYLGTPLIGSYGESSLGALQRRAADCKLALGSATTERGSVLAMYDALDDLRLAVDEPIVKGRLRRLLLLAFVHGGVSLVLSSVPDIKLSSMVAFFFLLSITGLYIWQGALGISQVLFKESIAAQAVRNLELEIRDISTV